MKSMEDAVEREWVDMDVEGELAAADKARLEERLAASSNLRRERKLLVALRELIADSRIAVRPGFARAVLSALPVAAWERRLDARRATAWVLPVAMMLMLAAGAALVMSFGGVSAADSHVAGLAATVFDFFQATTLAGAGLLFATWRGLGFGLEELVAGSGVSLVALGLAVLLLNWGFFALLRRKPAAVPADRRR